ncbi:AMIN domain-containing protein, partial [Lysobacter sp. 1R34A]|uniref:AMIN domain-containing protein n=1 Tax=Lysobacter sp. 1R34A TaxID=3445786 RepID=UPI003EE8598D
MRVKAATVQKFLLGIALLAALAWNLAHASEIKGLELRTGATGTRAEIALDQNADYKVLSLKGPDRLVVDLPASSVGKSVKLPAGAGIVKSVRTGAPQPGTVRIVFDLAQPVAALKPRIEQSGSGPRLVLEWPGDGVEPKTAVAAAPAPPSIAAASTAAAPAAKVDPSAESAAATSRLISELAARNAQAPATVASAQTPTAAASHSAAPATGPQAASPQASNPQASGVQLPSVQAQNRQAPGAQAPVAQLPNSQAPAPAANTQQLAAQQAARQAVFEQAAQAPMPAAVASGVPPRDVPTRIATGVPTRVATGVPTPMPGAA